MTLAALSPEARRDLLAAVRWIARDNPNAARGLRDAVAEVAARVGVHPLVGKQRPELTDGRYRFLMLSGFPYLIVYNAERRPPLIVRVLHGSRDVADVLRSL